MSNRVGSTKQTTTRTGSVPKAQRPAPDRWLLRKGKADETKLKALQPGTWLRTGRPTENQGGAGNTFAGTLAKGKAPKVRVPRAPKA